MATYSILSISEEQLITGDLDDQYTMITDKVHAIDPVRAFCQRFDMSRSQLIDRATQQDSHCVLHSDMLFIPRVRDEFIYVVVQSPFNRVDLNTTLHNKLHHAVTGKYTEKLL